MKRKLDSLSRDKCVVLLEDIVKRDKKKYHCLHDELPIVESTKDSWFSYVGSHYYPFGIINRITNERINEPFRVKVELSMKNDDRYAPCSLELTDIKGIYWLQFFKPHNKGTVVMKLSCVDDDTVEPLVHEIKVLVPGSSKSAKGGSAKKEEETKEKSKKKESFLDAKIDNPEDLNVPSLSVSQSIRYLQEIVSISDIFPQNSTKYRMDNQPPFLRPDSSVISGKEKEVVRTIFGPAFGVKMSNALLLSLYNDKAIISPLLTAYLSAASTTSSSSSSSSEQQAFQSLSKKQKREAERGLDRLMSPNILELFQAVVGHYKSLQHIQRIQDLIAFLCLLFDRLLFTHILYEEERAVYERWLGVTGKTAEDEVTTAEVSANSRPRRGGRRRESEGEPNEMGEEEVGGQMVITNYYEKFGPYFFLRFLVVVMMNVQPAENSTLSTGRLKGPVSDLEKLVDMSMKFLDDHSTMYFC